MLFSWRCRQQLKGIYCTFFRCKFLSHDIVFTLILWPRIAPMTTLSTEPHVWSLKAVTFVTCIRDCVPEGVCPLLTMGFGMTVGKGTWVVTAYLCREMGLNFVFTSIHCPACRTTLVATRFRVAVICPIIQVPHCIRVFFYFVWFVFINHIFQFYYELCTYCNILDIYLS